MSKSTTKKPEATHVDDLRKVFVQVTDSESPVTPGEVVQANEGINSRYARELLATLAQAELIVNTEDPEDPDSEGFQPNASLDMFNEWVGDPATPGREAKPSKSSRPTKDEGVHPCYCGCGENVPSKSFYRPGHDARHAGVLGRKVAEEVGKGIPRKQAMEHLNDLPSEKLVAKAEVIADKAIERAEKKANAKAGPESGTVKVGKNTYPAVRTNDGKVTYVKDDKEHLASASATKTFTVG